MVLPTLPHADADSAAAATADVSENRDISRIKDFWGAEIGSPNCLRRQDGTLRALRLRMCVRVALEGAVPVNRCSAAAFPAQLRPRWPRFWCPTG